MTTANLNAYLRKGAKLLVQSPDGSLVEIRARHLRTASSVKQLARQTAAGNKVLLQLPNGSVREINVKPRASQKEYAK